jgi:hypothetical protein
VVEWLFFIRFHVDVLQLWMLWIGFTLHNRIRVINYHQSFPAV